MDDVERFTFERRMTRAGRLSAAKSMLAFARILQRAAKPTDRRVVEAARAAAPRVEVRG